MLTSTYVRVQATSESGLTREETLQGRNYLVLPVVALVQGVLQGANSSGPEYAPASEFGRNIQGWNGRPVVMDHPQDGDGVYLSANSPEVINSWAIGWIFNSHIEDNKLKVEAWIDIARAEELGGNAAETLTRLQNDEMVEVSVGVFIHPVSKPGTYKGKKYETVWSNVVPDHLALLSNGAIGACSNDGGCGAPRLNRSDMADTNTVVVSGEGGGGDVSPAVAEVKPNCSCEERAPTTAAAEPTPTPAEEQLPVAVSLAALRAAHLSANAIPSDRFNADIYKAIYKAVQEKYKGYCYGYTTEEAVYDTYDSMSGSYKCYKVGINVDSNLVVEFTSAPTEVTIIMQIISQTEETMTTQATQPVGGDTAPAPVTTPAPAPVTVESYIGAAPAEVREILGESIRVHAERKTNLIDGLLSTNRCPYTKEELSSMTLDALSKLSKLADVRAPAVPTLADYSGQGAPRVEADNTNAAPAPIKVWG